MEMNIDTLLVEARNAIQSGHIQEAEHRCQDALAAASQHPEALHLMGLVQALKGEIHHALPLLQKAAQLRPEAAEILFDLAHALGEVDRLDDAAGHYRRVLKLAPSWPAPWVNLGSTLMRQGKADEAIDLLERGCRIFPNDPDLANTLGNALCRRGCYGEALAAYQRATRHAPERPDILHNQAFTLHALGEHAEAFEIVLAALRSHADSSSLKILAGSILHHYRPSRHDPALASLLATALEEGWAETPSLSSAGWALLDLSSEFKETIENHPVSPCEAIPRHPLFVSLLRRGVVNHPIWEIRLTRLRQQLLELVSNSVLLAPDLLETAKALAEQCFNNEYAFAQTEDEEARLDALIQRVAEQPEPAQALRDALVVHACYRPLSALPAPLRSIDALHPSLDGLFRQQLIGPGEEARIAASLNSLTPIAQGVSSEVQRQYEENPYPRWKSLPLVQSFGSPKQTLAALFPWHAPFSLPETPKILIAGAGTGFHALLTARRFPNADILAIDLSRASLAYAARKAGELGQNNLRFAQADILNLSNLRERFHIIESVGVLHHMEDTFGAWRLLAKLLEPNGLMKIGLYSRIGRAGLGSLRDEIIRLGLGGSAREIRTARAHLMAAAGRPDLASALARHDFYAISTCRDLLFHVHEHQFDLAELADMIEELELDFLGFEFSDPTVLRAYQAHHPGDPHLNDLMRWHLWELAHPHQFAGMYQFWVGGNA